MPEKYQCPFCECWFLTQEDLQRHLHTFSYPNANRDKLFNAEDHARLWMQSLRWRK